MVLKYLAEVVLFQGECGLWRFYAGFFFFFYAASLDLVSQWVAIKTSIRLALFADSAEMLMKVVNNRSRCPNKKHWLRRIPIETMNKTARQIELVILRISKLSFVLADTTGNLLLANAPKNYHVGVGISWWYHMVVLIFSTLFMVRLVLTYASTLSLLKNKQVYV